MLDDRIIVNPNICKNATNFACFVKEARICDEFVVRGHVFDPMLVRFGGQFKRCVRLVIAIFINRGSMTIWA